MQRFYRQRDGCVGFRAISGDDITEDILNSNRVCSRHFISGQAAKNWDKFNVDWVPSLHLGHDKKWDEENLQKGAERMQRANEKELKRKALNSSANS